MLRTRRQREADRKGLDKRISLVGGTRWHHLQPNLPFEIPTKCFGTDVTEYQDNRWPWPGVVIVSLLRMYGDGTERFSESFAASQPDAIRSGASAAGARLGPHRQSPSRHTHTPIQTIGTAASFSTMARCHSIPQTSISSLTPSAHTPPASPTNSTPPWATTPWPPPKNETGWPPTTRWPTSSETLGASSRSGTTSTPRS